MPSRRFHGTIAQVLEGGFFLHSWKKQFAIIYAGQAFSLVGSAAVQFAIIWQLTVQTESAITLTVAAIVGFIPNMVLGPFAGVWIDRCNPVSYTHLDVYKRQPCPWKGFSISSA